MGNKRISWTDNENLVLNKYYYNGTKKDLLNKIPNRSWDAVKLHAISLGFKKNRRKTKSFIAKLLKDTPLSYYWIGFLLADGHFSEKRVFLSLSKKDGSHVKKFATYIKSNYHINKKGVFSTSAMDTKNIPILRKKFKISNRKTYEPSAISWIKNKNLLLSLIIGFIDGDGCIRKQYKRQDSVIVIKCHSSWLFNLQFISNVICEYCNFQPNIARITNTGYATVNFSNSIILKFLKAKTKELNLPVLKRKWDRIDENFIGKVEAYKYILEEVKELIKEGLKNYDIAAIVNRSHASIYQMVKKHNLRKI